MEYKMKVVITDPKTPEGMTNALFFDLECNFVCDENQYGNGHYATIRGENFHEQIIDLRYDKSFNRNNKENWLEKWAKSYWNGQNGSWVIKSLEITKTAQKEKGGESQDVQTD